MWQPIETAPRDNTVILLALEGGDFPIVGCCAEPWEKFGTVDGDEFYPQPTHWMQIPELP